MSISKITTILETHTDIELAILVGSPAEGRERADSDWDIAIQWQRESTNLENLAKTETLRRSFGDRIRH